MSTHHTTNYDLNQWEASDKVLRTEFNTDNAKIDAALKANADAIAAEAAGLAALTATAGTLRFDSFSYVGNGNDTQNQRTFPHKPVMFIIMAANDYGLLLANVSGGCGISFDSYSSDMQHITVSASGSLVTIKSVNQAYHLNKSGKTYWVFSIYQET